MVGNCFLSDFFLVSCLFVFVKHRSCIRKHSEHHSYILRKPQPTYNQGSREGKLKVEKITRGCKGNSSKKSF